MSLDIAFIAFFLFSFFPLNENKGAFQTPGI